MSSITVRNIDEELKQRLKEQAARHGVSMEEGSTADFAGGGAEVC